VKWLSRTGNIFKVQGGDSLVAKNGQGSGFGRMNSTDQYDEKVP